MRALISVAVVAAAAGAAYFARPAPPPPDYRHRLERGPVVTAQHEAGPGQVLRIQIPSATMRGNPVFDTVCFVWRDHEYRTATLHCPYSDALAQ